jgi:hypothetical protein
MDDDFIIAAYVTIADSMREFAQESHRLAKVSDPEVLTVAVVAAKFFHNHQERALCVMIRSGYIPALSVSRYNRRLHALAWWLESALVLLGELFAKGDSVHHRQLALACPFGKLRELQARQSQALQEGQGQGLLRLLCR